MNIHQESREKAVVAKKKFAKLQKRLNVERATRWLHQMSSHSKDNFSLNVLPTMNKLLITTLLVCKTKTCTLKWNKGPRFYSVFKY